MSLETARFDIVYGSLLKKGVSIDKARSMAKFLIDASAELGIDIEILLAQVSANGIRFENSIYDRLNKARTNSSQIGFLDTNNIPPAILQQVI